MMYPPIEDVLFGTLKYDASVGWYYAEVEFSPGQCVRVCISIEGFDPDTAVEQARGIFGAVQAEEGQLRRLAAQEKLSLYNDHWSQGERINQDEFARRMKFSSITFHPEGWIDLWYEDGDMFAGHSIMVAADPDLHFHHVELAG